MFLHTLSIGNIIVTTAFNKKIAETGIVACDQRGKHANRPNKLSATIRDDIRKHTASFLNVESHYIRIREQSEQEYLEEGLTLSKMYTLNKQWCREQNATVTVGKRWLYEHIFNFENNIGFFKPKKDQCSLCEKFCNGSDEEQAVLLAEFEEHQTNKERSRHEKEIDKERSKTDKSFICLCYDL